MANGSSGAFRHQGTVLAPTNAPLGGESAIAGRYARAGGGGRVWS